MSSAPTPGQIHTTVKTFGSAGTPFTISEISDSFDCAEQALSDKLETLVDDGVLESKDIGAGERVWWRPSIDQNQPRRETAGPYQQLFESVTRGLCILEVVFDGDGQPADYRFLSTNPAFESFTGLENVAGTRMREMGLEPEDHWFEKFGPVAKRGESMRFTQYAEQLGERWYEIDAVRVGDPDDHTVAILLDETTDTKEREQELRSQQEWREAIFEGSRDAVFITDSDAAIVDVNTAAAELTGYDREELLSMRIPDLHEEMDMDAYREYNDRILAGESMTTEAQVLRADGSNVHVEFSNQRVEINGDIYIHTTARDVTERKQREIELEQHEVYLESISECISVLDENRIFRYESPNISEQLGYDQDERIGELAFEYVHPADRDRVKERFQSRLDGDGPETTEFRARAKDGTWTWLEAQGNNLIDSKAIDGMIITTRVITERKQRTQESEMLWQAIEKADSPLVLAEPDGDDNPLVYVNEAFEELTGYAESEALGRDCRFLQGENTRQAPLDALSEAIGNGESVTVELRNYRKDGTEFWNKLTIDPVYNSDGELVRYLGTQEDITDRKEREIELERHEIYLQNTSERISVVDADGVFKYESEGVSDQLGYDPDERIGEVAFNYVHPADIGELTNQFERLRTHGGPETAEFRSRAKDGSWVWLEAQANSPTDSQVLDGYIISTRVITERKKREAELERNNIYLEHVSDAITVLDSDGIIRYESPAVTDVLGYEPSERLGESAFRYAHPEDRDRLRESFKNRLTNGGQTSDEFRVRTKDGDWVWIEASGNTLDDSAVVDGVIMTYRNITERKEQKRKRSQVVDRATDGIFRTNEDGELTSISDRATKLLNASDTDLIGRYVLAVFDEAQGTEFADRFHSVLNSRESTSFVAPYPGQGCWFDVQMYPNDDGGVSVYFRDVTERKEREAAQQRAEKQYKTLLELAPLPIVAVKSDTKEIIEINESAETSFVFS